MPEKQLNSVFDNDPSHYNQLRHCWLNDRREQFVRKRLEALRSQRPLSVLEIGSGTGWLLSRLSCQLEHWRFHGVDPLPSYVGYAREHYTRPNLLFSAGTGEALPSDILPGSIDVVLSNDVLHHVESLTETIDQLSRVCRLGAKWYVIEPNARNPYAFLRQAFRAGERNFWPSALIESAHAAGWNLTTKGYLFLVPPGIISPPTWMKKLEQCFEWIPFLAGGVTLELEYATLTQETATPQ